MEQHPEHYSHSPALAEQNSDIVTGVQVRTITEGAKHYLSGLFKKAGVMEEESHYPILAPDEHTYINRTISAAAHLVTYWSELPDVKMPPQDKLGDTIDVLRKTGTKLESTTEDILNDKEMFKRLLSRVVSRQQHTSNREPQENIRAIICARELVDLLEFMAASNGDKLPLDYSVDISLREIAHHPEGPDFKELLVDTVGLRHLLDGLEPDSSGYIRLDETRRLKLESILRDCGVAVRAPTPQEIQSGIESAGNLVKQGSAGKYLESLPIIHREDIPDDSTTTALIALEHPIYINPGSILGVNKITNWAGLGQHDRNDDFGDEKPFLEIVKDYATRGTRLPSTDVRIFIQKNSELVIFTENERRTAAAKLRLEPLAVDTIRFYI